MSYTVEYNPELRNSYPMEYRKQRKLPIKAMAVALGVFVTLYALNAAGVLRYIIPGDPAVTAGAFSSMVEQVRSGQTVREAIFTFIKDIILGGMQ